MKIKRSEGITPSEKYLKKLCDRAFLSLWSYSGIYRDQKQGQKGDGKELCDLLVVFENHIIIFSDKYIEFPDSGNIQLDWNRWYRRAVEDSAKQIFGAERWIKSFPDRLFIDRECTQRFPVEFPSFDDAIFHRVVIAHGVAEKCKEFFNGGSGSLLIDNGIIGDGHESELFLPFSIGKVNEQKGYVHVFNEVTLDVVLQQLDTVTDFVSYLNKKERFLSGNLRVHVPGEEELLAYYLQNLDDMGEHDFILPKKEKDITFFMLEEGFWDDFVKSPQRQSQLEADRISYSWDALIETFNKHILDDTQYLAYPKGVSNQEKTVKLLARENRTRRRMLTKSLYELMAKTLPTKLGARVGVPTRSSEPYYVFLLLPKPDDFSEEGYREYREKRGAVLEAYCLVVKYKFPNAEDIVGLATESGRGEAGSEDLLYFDARQWNEEDQELAAYYHNEVGFLKTVNQFAGTEYEFPIEQRQNQASTKRKKEKKPNKKEKQRLKKTHKRKR